MSDERTYDEETQKFYDENREMIEKIIAQQKSSRMRDDLEYLEEMSKRAAFEAKMRAEFEAEKARRQAFVRADQLHSDMIDARICTEEAFEEAQRHIHNYSRKQMDSVFDMMTEQFDHLRATARRGREYAERCYEEDKEFLFETRDRVRENVNEGLDDILKPLTNTQFQKHLVGAGIEMWMALNSLIRAAPVPESIKDAFSATDKNKNSAFCSKNEYCKKRPTNRTEEKPADPVQPQQIKITPIKKEESE